MFILIFSLVFLAFAALFTFLGVLKGKKYTWMYSVSRIVCAIVCAILTMALSGLAGNLLGGLLLSLLGGVLPGQIGQLLEEVPSMGIALRALLVAVIAPVLFVPLFAIVYNVANIFVKMILKPLMSVIPHKVTGVATNESASDDAKGMPKKKKRVRNAALRAGGKNPIGALCGGLCGLLLFGIVLIPFACGTATLDAAVGMVRMMLPEDGAVDTVVDVIDASANNVGSYAVRNLGGQLLYDGMTTYEEDGLKVQMDAELELVGSIAHAASACDDENVSRPEAASAVLAVEDDLNRATLIPRMGAEFLEGANRAWDKGETFAGIEEISLGEYGELTDSLVDAMSHGDDALFKEDAGAIIHILALMVEHDAKIEEPMGLIKNEALMSGILYEMLENERLSPTVSIFFNLSIDIMGDSLGWKPDMATAYEDLCRELLAVEQLTDPNDEEALNRVSAQYQAIFDAYGIEVDAELLTSATMASAEDEDFDPVAFFADRDVVSSETMAQKSVMISTDALKIEAKTVADKENESKKMAEALSVFAGVADTLSEEESGTTKALSQMGPALDALAATESVGAENSAQLMTAIIQSEKVISTMGISMVEATNIANDLNKNAAASSYAEQTRTVAQSVDAVQKAATGDAKESIQTLLQDLTPESASTMQSIMTPNVVKAQGVPEKSAEPTADMMSNMFGNLSDAKEEGMDEAQLEKETAAVNNVMTMAMNAGDSNGRAFGEGSATGTTAKGFVDELMDSQVVSTTLVEQVYGEGTEPQVDPLATERNISEEEQAELMDAINEKWSTATEEEKADGTYEQKLTAIAAVLNMPIAENGNGVFEIVQPQA